LYIVGFLLGGVNLFFDVAYMSYLPEIVSHEQLIESNSKFELSSSISSIGGPSIAGILVQFLSAPFAILADALSYLVSAFFTWRLPRDGRHVSNNPGSKNVWGEVREGLQMVFTHKVLRSLIVSSGLFNLCTSIFMPVYIFYVTRGLGISILLYGVITASAGAGALVGAIVSKSLSEQIGIGRTIQMTGFLTATGFGIAALPTEITGPNIALLMIGMFLNGLASTVRNIQQISLRVRHTPPHIQGRMNATFRLVNNGIIPIGSILGGIIGGVIGFRFSLVLVGVFAIGIFVYLLLSPIRNIRSLRNEAIEK
jgi:Transmembrane secretion effector